MQSNVNTRPEGQMQDRIRRIAEGVLLVGGTVVGIWLLAAIAMSFMK